MLLSIQHQRCSAQALCKGGSPCMPVVLKWIVCPHQEATLLAARRATSSHVTDFAVQSREDATVATVEALGSMEWYQAADPQFHLGLQGSTSQHGTCPPNLSAAIVSIKTAMDAIALERDIGLLQQKMSNTRKLEYLRAARIQGLQAAVVSQGLTLPSTAGVSAVINTTSYQQPHTKHVTQSAAGHLSVLTRKYESLKLENEAVMARCRVQSTQVQALEALLIKSGMPLPRRSLASVLLSSCSPLSSVASTGSVGDGDPALPTITSPAATQAPKTPGRHTVKCRFEVKCDASPGTRIWIVGNDPALGSWDVDSGKALLLQRSEGNIWTGDLSVEWEQWDYYSPRLLAFKAVRQGVDGRLESQQGHNLEILVGPSMGHHVHPCVASWEFDSCNTSDNPLNFEEACQATYDLNYDCDVPKVVATKKAQEDVQKCIQQLRGAVAR